MLALDHSHAFPPIKISELHERLPSTQQHQALALIAQLWASEAVGTPLSPLVVGASIDRLVPPGLVLMPLSISYVHGLCGHVALVRNRRGRGVALCEEYFFDYLPRTLAVGLHAQYLKADAETCLFVAALAPVHTEQGSAT